LGRRSKREDILGGDLEAKEDGDVYRGPIKAMHVGNGSLVIELEWVAKMTPGKTGWEVFTPPEGYSLYLALDGIVQPQDIGQNRIFYDMPGLGHATIFPQGGSKLEPAKVKGLNLSS